ncbi:MAG: DUF1156 domain-containing protein [Bacteroidetes bacterium]|nr:DUF1156 domain-containing protein [Bacteroidota bacterium]
MIPRECKRLAEVDFPIAEVSYAAIHENKRVGHPSGLHSWWARRPLPSCRAILLALLLPDPCDPHCSNKFKEKARRILLSKDGKPGDWSKTIESDEGLRKIILNFIADISASDHFSCYNHVGISQALINAAYDEDIPLVVDPFSGGGSIPLEALRIGCEIFASDLNPVACLILKVMLDTIPRHCPELAQDLDKISVQIKHQVEKRLIDLYPVDSNGDIPTAYLWARTVRCEAPNCGAEIPLMRSFWLCKKAKRKRAIRPIIERSEGLTPSVKFEIFEPTSDKEVPLGTVTRAKATCLCCGSVLPPDRVREQLRKQKGGADVIFDEQGRRIGGARMTAVVTLRAGQKGRYYRIANDADYEAVRKSQERLDGILKEWELGGKQGLCPVPDEPLPPIGTLGFRVQRYGMMQWGDLFTARQKVALAEIALFIRTSQITDTLRELLACCLSLFSRQCNGNARMRPDSSVAPAFGMQTLPITWSFPETTLWGGRSEHLDGAISKVICIVQRWPVHSTGDVQLANASNHTLPDQSADIWFTDPPYYDAIPYSDLSDFFLVWLKRALPGNSLLQDPFDPSNPLSPKVAEIVQDETKNSANQPKNHLWFEKTISKAFGEGRRIVKENAIGSVVFAHKTTEGWEALLSGMIQGGWTITGSWPIATETPSRLRARESAALDTSVHLICRPRSDDAYVGDWADVLRELPQRVTRWMSRLENDGIRGADLVFACIGPALEIFSRYSTVETSEGREVKLSEYLEKVWEVVGRTALERVLSDGDGLAGRLEEDARLTALFLWTLQSTKTPRDQEEEDVSDVTIPNTKGFTLPFDVVRRFSQPMGIDLDIWKDTVISQQKGVVRLLPVTERIKVLFGEDGDNVAAKWVEIDSQKRIQGELFNQVDNEENLKQSHRRKKFIGNDSEFKTNHRTILDRVHIAMVFHANGYTNEWRELIHSEQRRGPEFQKLANALSALYPTGSWEKRKLDAMLPYLKR